MEGWPNAQAITARTASVIYPWFQYAVANTYANSALCPLMRNSTIPIGPSSGFGAMEETNGVIDTPRGSPCEIPRDIGIPMVPLENQRGIVHLSLPQDQTGSLHDRGRLDLLHRLLPQLP